MVVAAVVVVVWWGVSELLFIEVKPVLRIAASGLP